MFFQHAIAALLVASASANIKANTPKGRALLKNAKVIQPSSHLRKLQENDYNDWNEYQNEQNQEFDLAQLSLKYIGCSSWTTASNEWQDNQDQQAMQYYYQDQQQQGQEGEQEGEQQNEQDQWDDGLDTTNLVRFQICSQGCGKCDGEFAVDMAEFVDAYTESKMTTLEYQCELLAERCYCNNGNWQQCFYDCFQQAEFDLYGTSEGVQYCLNNYYGQEQFEIQRYLECAEVEQYENNQQQQNQYNGQQQQEDVQYYVGPQCVDNTYIYLAAFYDEDCTYPAQNAKFSSQNYGSSFPYFKESIISPNECISCQEGESYYEMKQAVKQAQYWQQQYNNGANYQGNGEQAQGQNYYWDEELDFGDATEVCNTWEDAIKCDSNRGFYSGCTFLQQTLPTLDGRGTYTGTGINAFDSTYDKLTKNKNIAIAMGVIAGVLLCVIAFMCGMCGGGSSDSKKISLLEEKRSGDDGVSA